MNVTVNYEITGKTKCVCLLGHPVAHSISPQIHNRAFQKLGLPYVYVPLDVSSKNLHAAIGTIRESMAGANVTIPHKEAALKYCDEISELSKATGTVNTLYMRDGKLCGTTTDSVGFYKAVESIYSDTDRLSSAEHIWGKDVVILGSGGTARTLGAAMVLDKKCKSLTIAARSEDKAKALVSSLEKLGTIPIEYCMLKSNDRAGASPAPTSSRTVPLVGATLAVARDLENIFAKCTLLINCTNVGMSPNINDTPLDKTLFHDKMIVFDAIYNPSTTKFLKDAANAGCKTKNGLLMLLYQGLESFRYWTGIEAPTDLFDEKELQTLVGG
jgi:shikimate dehydrogenase